MPTIDLTLRQPHPEQWRIKREAERFNVVDCGRRWGKTVLGQDLAIEPMLRAEPVGWFAPTYKILAEAWREIRGVLQPLARKVSEQEHRIELVTGGVLEMWSLDSADAGRSRRYKRVIVDEAARVSNLEEAWGESIRPTLADLEGDAYFLSTPKGKNYFYRLFLRGSTELNWRSWQQPTSANPFIPPREIEAARLELPERVFAQEFLAEFIEDSGGVFRHVSEAVDKGRTESSEPIKGMAYTTGLDLARVEDFTVLSVLDRFGVQVYFERFNQIDWSRQVASVAVVNQRYPGLVVVDSTGVGDPVFEQLLRAGVNAIGVKISGTSKPPLIDKLAVVLDREQIRLMDVPQQTRELQSYEYDVTPHGNIRTQAPEGEHDDTVIALALAVSQCPFIGSCRIPTPPPGDTNRTAPPLRKPKRETDEYL
jgi:hypothetical protein